MIAWRLGLGFVLLLGAGLPLAAPVVELCLVPEAWQAFAERPRFQALAANSLLLAGGTLALALPLGLVAAVLLFRTDLPARKLWQALVLTSLFVPLPLVATAWQLLVAAVPTGSGAGVPGLVPAALIHALAALPWVTVLIGLGLSWVEPELEEDALTHAPAWVVLRRVTFPRARPSLVLAGLATVLCTLNEVAVTDILLVRTSAEEVYTQIVGGSAAEVARATALALPAVVLTGFVTFLVLQSWRTALPPRATLVAGPRLFPLGTLRWPALLLVLSGVFLLAGVPVAVLIHKAGLRYASAAAPGPPAWDGLQLVERLATASTQQAKMLLDSLLLGLATGTGTGFLALLCCWLSRGCHSFTLGVWTLAAVLWAVPGPVLGLGLLSVIQWLLPLPGGELVKLLLWERPSPLPSLWVCTLRFFPLALAVLWPLVRLIPPEFEEAALLEGAGPCRRFCRVIVPVMRGPLLWAILGVAVLTLGELSAGKLVAPAGFTPLAHHVFQQMHASADTELAALCLLLLTFVGAGGLALATLCRSVR